DGEVLAFKRSYVRRVAHRFQRVGERLQRDADDWYPTDERVDELSSLRPFTAAGNGHERTGGGDELVDGVAKLLVEHLPVGEHEHRVEHFLTIGRMQGGQPVRGPRD